MAVAKMQKAILICDHSVQDELLKNLQDLQCIELYSMRDKLKEDRQWKFLGSEAQDLQHQQERLAVAIQFLQRHSTRKPEKLSFLQMNFQTLNKRAQECDFIGQTEKILALKQEKERLRTERQANEKRFDELLRWKDIVFEPKELERYRYCKIAFYEADAALREDLTDTLNSDQALFGEIIHQNNEKILVLIAVLRKECREIMQKMQEFGLKEVEYPFNGKPQEVLRQAQARREALLKTEADIQKQIDAFSAEISSLMICEEFLLAAIEREEHKKRLLASEHALIFTGWLPVHAREQFEGRCKTLLGEDYCLGFEEILEEKVEDIPVLLKNKKLVESFEGMTEMYSLPRYNELDPTPMMSLFYWLFFGMMVADFGYGALLCLGTIIALRFLPFRRSMKKQLRFFHLLSYSAMIWGLIYGTAFGVELPFHLLSSSADVNTILLLSVVLGYIQILCGLAMKALMLWREKKKFEMFSDPGSWIGILLSAGVLALAALILKNQTIMIVAGVMAALFALLILVGSIVRNKSKGKGLAKGLYELYGISGYLGDLVSYTRLMALGIAGGSIGAAFNMIVAFMPAVARYSIGIVILVALHGLNIFLTMLSAYVHSARLQYVEFFGKFFEGGGRAFAPLKTKEKHFDIERDS